MTLDVQTQLKGNRQSVIYSTETDRESERDTRHRKAMTDERAKTVTVTAERRKTNEEERRLSAMQRQKIICMTGESNKTMRETSTKPAQLLEKEKERKKEAWKDKSLVIQREREERKLNESTHRARNISD